MKQTWVYDIYLANEILVLKKIERISVSTGFHLFHTVVPSSLLLAVWGLHKKILLILGSLTHLLPPYPSAEDVIMFADILYQYS